MQRFMHSSKVLIATLCLAAQAFVVGHHVLVEHTRCAEHGEMVHAGSHEDHASLSADVDATTASDVVAEGDAAHSDDHEHCVATSDRRKAVVLAALVLALAPVSMTDVEVTPPQQPLLTQAVVRLAPKTSPPV